MQPKTKLQKRVFALSEALPEISQEQKAWAFKNMFDKVAYRTKTKTSCLECGHVWPGVQKVKTCNCPKCGIKLKVEDTKKQKLFQSARCMSIVTVSEEFQVVRFYEAWAQKRSGEEARYNGWEICQQFINPETCKMTAVARYAAGFNGGLSGNMEIRVTEDQWGNQKHNYFSERMYPVIQAQPLFARNGFTKPVPEVNPYSFLRKLIASSRCETLLKANQIELLSCAVNSSYENKVQKHWNSIKICLRNNYIVKDGVSYLDYLDLLAYFEKDLHNAHYVCPANFHREHNKYVKKKQKVEDQQRRDRNAREAERARLRQIDDAAQLLAGTTQYLIDKAPYIGLEFNDHDLTISVLKNVDEFKECGSVLGSNCIYSSKYYDRERSLCLVTRVDGVITEVIEVTLDNFKIQQARGYNNHASKFNTDIVELVKKNMRHIKQRHHQSRTLKSIAA